MKDSPIPRAGVIGDPIGHSLSPRLFDFFSKALEKPVEYSAILVGVGELCETFGRLREEGLVGFNVTRPHKKAVLSLVDAVSDAARACGAVNVVAFTSEEAIGHNTDAAGFGDALALADFSVKGQDAVIFGAGGAAQAAVFELKRLGASNVMLCRRGEKAPQAELWVNATPLGWKEGEPSPAGESSQCRLAFDMVYGRETKFLSLARASGAKAVDGRGMLAAQALRSWEIWFGPLGEYARRKLAEQAIKELKWD
jgi:shikimate dehydrogenase